MKNMKISTKYITISFLWIKMVIAISPNKNIIYSTYETVGDITDYIASKGYIPNEKELFGAPLIKSNDNDATYILSKLSDKELLKLLNDQPQKNEYSLNDIMRIAFDTKIGREHRSKPTVVVAKKENADLDNLSPERKRKLALKNNEPLAYYRLNHKPVDLYKGQNDANYIALQKLKKLLNAYPQSKTEDNFDDNDDRKQLIFDILIDQLKTLCCKNSKTIDFNNGQYKTLINGILPSLIKQKVNIPNGVSAPINLSNKYNEFMFLIINDEIKSSASDDLIEVDPESLDGNSSVLLLGPVTSPLTDDQLKLVMNRISNELIKPEYISLLRQLSNGVLNNSNKNLLKDFVFGPKTRRYIKPHRCNHQSKLAKVYGGPKWVVCTGYLNLNKPSLYD